VPDFSPADACDVEGRFVAARHFSSFERLGFALTVAGLKPGAYIARL
jgi:hypothetical protein